MKEFLLELQSSAWQTAGARYDAARRLKRKELFSTVSLAFFSALMVVLAFLQRIYSAHPGSNLDNYLTALSAGLGVFLLVLSLMEWGAANGAKSDALHRNAESLNAHQRKIAQALAQLDHGVAISWVDVEVLRSEYESIKERCPHNHEPLDYECFRASQRFAPELQRVAGEPLMNSMTAGWITFRHWWSAVWFFLLLWAVIAAGLILTPWNSA